jgi:tetratricopeptide (TPR) repeat protein
VQLVPLRCSDRDTQWTSSGCKLRPLATGFDHGGLPKGFVPPALREPSTKAEAEQAAQRLEGVLAELCGKHGASRDFGVNDCIDAGVGEARYRNIAFAAKHLGAAADRAQAPKASAEAWYWRAVALQKLGQSAAALAAYQDVLKVPDSPRAASAQEVFAQKACSEQLRSDAMFIYQTIVERYPKSPEAERARAILNDKSEPCGGGRKEQKK